MSISRHHAEWLSLVEASGPFLSMPVLLRAFPQGLDAHDPEILRILRLAYEEWDEGRDRALHTAWIGFVLRDVLSFPPETIAEGQSVPATLGVFIAEHGETLRPDLVIVDPPRAATAGTPRLLIKAYPRAQSLEKSVAGSHWQSSPASRMMELLHATGIRLGLITNGEHWMLVDAPRGEATGYASWYAALWLEEHVTLRAFRSLLGAQRFFGVAESDTLEALLAESAKDQYEVTDQLGYQVRRAVEMLVRAIDRIDQDRGRKLLVGIGEAELYEAALTVMMRLVFLFSAEERGLLLLGDPLYDQNYAVSTLRAQLREAADQQGEEVLERRTDAWCRLLATFRAVWGGVGHENLHLPAYGGSLFNPDRFPFLEGRAAGTRWHDAAADPLPIDNRAVLHLLEALQMLQVKVPGGGPAQARRLSFRALDIEQIGHVYEGLLDHTAVRATEPVLGLLGTKEKEPEVALSELEQRAAGNRQRATGKKRKAAAEAEPGEELLAFLVEQTGRSESALRKALVGADGVRTAESPRLQAACGNDTALYERVLRFAPLVRDDDYGWPIVIPTGSVYVTAGADRRSTGTHYTPRSMTEPIVQHTLEPLVYIGPAEGKPREEWLLRTAAELLDLKLCDLTTGSGSFLVQSCRYLAERLVEAWEVAIAEHPGEPHITPEGQVSRGGNHELLIPKDPDERMALARRLVVDRCLYGVDKNPLAVEMAKLSLWLITLDKQRPFTFIDHALRCGDSLVGADEAMYREWARGGSTTPTLFDTQLEHQLANARQARRAIAQFDTRNLVDAEHKAALLHDAEQELARVRLGCDLLVGTRLLGLKPREQERRLERLLFDYLSYLNGETDAPPASAEAQEALAAAKRVRAFHWPFEFPEVFERGGFSGFMGNPPFLGGQRISTMLGEPYLRYVHAAYPSSKGTADLCALFFLRTFSHSRIRGVIGLIATNTIAQGDTREASLDYLISNGAEIYRADSSTAWPGVAAVAVSIVHIIKGKHAGPKMLDSTEVTAISPLLDSSIALQKPEVLAANAGVSFIGSYVLGMGFVLEPDEARALIARDPRNEEVLFPYLNAEDLNSRADQSPSRWIINFRDWPIERARQYTACFRIVEQNVRPERANNNRKGYRDYWWQHGEKRPALYAAISHFARVLVCPIVSKYVSFVLVPTTWIYAHRLAVFAFDRPECFAVLQSQIHEMWVRRYSSTLETRLNYSPSDCFETYPFPPKQEASPYAKRGEQYYHYRHNLMLARQEGLTATYNRFHDPAETAAEIAHLRELHVEMDHAVAAAYGWRDLDLGHGFHETPLGVRFVLSEPARREVLARLLALNHERWEEEERQGLHEKKKSEVRSPKSGVRRGGKGRGRQQGGEEEAGGQQRLL